MLLDVFLENADLIQCVSLKVQYIRQKIQHSGSVLPETSFSRVAKGFNVFGAIQQFNCEQKQHPFWAVLPGSSHWPNNCVFES